MIGEIINAIWQLPWYKVIVIAFVDDIIFVLKTWWLYLVLILIIIIVSIRKKEEGLGGNMTKQQAIRESIAHWERMIAWVEKQPKIEEPDRIEMEYQIGEDWYAKHCPLCKLYYRDELCTNCPLKAEYGKCDNDGRNAWHLVSSSPTWAEWLRHAKKMLEQLKSLEEKGLDKMRKIVYNSFRQSSAEIITSFLIREVNLDEKRQIEKLECGKSPTDFFMDTTSE